MEKKGNNGQDQKKLLGEMPEATTSTALCFFQLSGAEKGTVTVTEDEVSQHPGTEWKGNTRRHSHYPRGDCEEMGQVSLSPSLHQKHHPFSQVALLRYNHHKLKTNADV